jgi:hypothetical protein
MEGIKKSVLRSFIYESLKSNPETNYHRLVKDVWDLTVQKDAFPTEKECLENEINFHNYKEKQLNPIDNMNINEIMWDLIIERILTIGSNNANEELPHLRLTEFGESVINQTTPSYYDHDEYIKILNTTINNLDNVILQYILEGLKCYKQQLFFASGVMFGAASEKSILLLLEAIYGSESKKDKKKKIKELLEHGRLPSIFSMINSYLDGLIKNKTIPYNIHQGCNTHLLSLYEMVRVQRNEAVHPDFSRVSKEKVYLALLSFPVALQVIYRLIEWFENNKI